MNAISKGTLELLRKTYKQGTRVKLICMDDTQAPPKGTKGTVVGVDDMGSVMVHWDNGSSLSLVYGVDSAWILHSVTTVCYGEKIVWDSRDDALAFFLNGIQNSEGSEQERYATIYSQLKSGEDFASDEVE